MNETRLIRLEKDDILFQEGDTSREMYILRSGKVRVFLSHGGRMIPLTELGKGCIVGEMSFISGIPRTATVKVLEPGVANVITTDLLVEDDLGITGWSLAIARFLVQRIQKTTTLLGDYLVTEKVRFVQKGGEAQREDNLVIQPDTDFDPVRLYLRGFFTEKDVDRVKRSIRELKQKDNAQIVLDFSDVIDIDSAAMNYLFQLTQSTSEGRHGILIENVQLIRNKVSAIKGIQNIVTRTQMPIRRVEAGDVLIQQGAIENSMYVVKTGLFSIYREAKGEKIALGQAESGEVLGEMSLIKEGKRSASVRAEKSSNVYVIETREFYKNIYNVPNWFLDVIRGLVERLRQTNVMLGLLVKNRKKREVQKTWPSPFGLVMDSRNEGKFILQGNLTLENMTYLSCFLNMMLERGNRNITLDLSRLKRIDRKCISYFLHLYVDLKAKGGSLTLTGPQKDVLKLFRQYEIEISDE